MCTCKPYDLLPFFSSMAELQYTYFVFTLTKEKKQYVRKIVKRNVRTSDKF